MLNGQISDLQPDFHHIPVHFLNAAGQFGLERLIITTDPPQLPQEVNTPPESTDNISFRQAICFLHQFNKAAAPAPTIGKLMEAVVKTHPLFVQGLFLQADQLFGNFLGMAEIKKAPRPDCLIPPGS